MLYLASFLLLPESINLTVFNIYCEQEETALLDLFHLYINIRGFLPKLSIVSFINKLQRNTELCR